MTCRHILISFLAVFALTGIACGQYNSDFESLVVTAVTGTPLTDPLSAATGFPIGTPCASLPLANQDCYYVPAATTSVIWNVFPYSGNSLGIPQNPAGGSQFIAGTGPGGGTYARAQRDLTFSGGTWTLGFDICATFGGTLPTAQNIGSVSLQPTTAGTGQTLIMLATWTDVNTAATWNADYVSFDAAGTSVTAAVPNPGFQGLPINTWYRWETDVDFTTNLVMEMRLTDIAAGTTVSHCPTGMYLSDTAPGQGLPQALRWFAGGGTADNTMAIDNASLAGSASTPEYQVNQPGSSLDINGAASSPCGPVKVTSVVGAFSTFHLASTSPGPWDLLITTPEPSVPLSGAGFLLGSQIVNMNVGAPSFQALLGLTLTTPFAPVPVFFAAPVPMALTVQMVNLDPATPGGIALSAPNELTVLPCPSSANFDNLTTGVGVYPSGWGDGGGAVEWGVYSGLTTSGSTGPLVGAFSLPNYLYCETSSSVAGGTFIMDTCQMDFLSLQNFTLDFRLSRIGATIGTLNVWQTDASGAFTVLLATYTGAEPAGVDWTPESLPIVLPATGTTMAFRFEYISGTSFTGDLALDDILLW